MLNLQLLGTIKVHCMFDFPVRPAPPPVVVATHVCILFSFAVCAGSKSFED